ELDDEAVAALTRRDLQPVPGTVDALATADPVTKSPEWFICASVSAPSRFHIPRAGAGTVGGCISASTHRYRRVGAVPVQCGGNAAVGPQLFVGGAAFGMSASRVE